jgi:exosortase
MTQQPTAAGRTNLVSSLAPLAVAAVALLWAYWPTLGEMAQRWGHDPQYSHGFLVPLFAVLLLWLRRDRLARGTLRPSWWGLPLLAAGLALRLVGGFFYYVSFDDISLLPCIAGLCLVLGGWPAWRWSWPAIAFLAFMIPLPYRVSVMLAGPLQAFATQTSTFCLQTLGFPALAEGNVILLNEVEIGIVEACSGLRMLVIFFALSTGMALLIRRRLADKIFIVLSAIPIALVVNIIRITATGILHDTVGSAWANAVFHDLAGWLMMPLALGILALELLLLKRLLIEQPSSEPVRSAFGLRKPQPVAAMAKAMRPRPTRSRRPAPHLAARRAGETR